MPEPRLRLSVRLRHRVGALDVDVSFELTHPWTILFGPSGSGKTTVLRTIAGLIRPDFARIVLSDPGRTVPEIVLVDTETGKFLPAHARKIPLALQRPSLFPHLTVDQNVRFGAPEQSSTSPDEHQRPIAVRFGIEDLRHKYPAQLSGGEAQRVNLARTVAAPGRVLLLDEPFTGLDGPARAYLQRAIAEVAAERGSLVLSVTHDIAEPFEVNAEVIRLAEGRILCRGPAARVLTEERTRLLHRLGMGLTPGVASQLPPTGEI